MFEALRSLPLLFVLTALALVHSSIAAASATCVAGQYPDGAVCAQCSLGHYCPDGLIQKLCPIGMFSNALGATQCLNCRNGQYQDVVGQEACKPCSGANQYTNLAHSTCYTCPSGQVANSDHLGCTTQVSGSCPTGHYMEGGSCIVCPVGNYCPGDSKNYACPAGKYQDTTGSTACKVCAAGSASSTAGRTVACITCGNGLYQPAEGQTACRSCNDADMFTNAAHTTCETCAHGMVANAYHLGCVYCPAGKYESSNGICTTCPAGYKCSEGKRPACPAGTYQPQTGQSICVPCAVGTASEAVARTTACPPCPAGSYADATGLSSCTPCVAGTASSVSGRSTACPACANGSYQASVGKTTCDDCSGSNQFTDAFHVTCETCSLGMSADANHLTCLRSTVCDPGFYLSGSDCVICPPGHSCNNNQKVPCSAGTYQDLRGKTSCELCVVGSASSDIARTTPCDLCQPGTFADAAALTECKACEAGTISTIDGAVICDPCSNGEYQPYSGRTACLPCGGSNEFTGADHVDCQQCPDGKFASDDHLSCVLCPADMYEADPMSGICMKCPPGSFIVDLTTRAEIAECPAGSFCAGGDAMPVPCPVGEYQDATGATVCLLCPPGKGNDAIGATSCSICPAGSYSSNGQCDYCTGGTYSQAGSSLCLPCDPMHIPNYATLDSCVETTTLPYVVGPVEKLAVGSTVISGRSYFNKRIYTDDSGVYVAYDEELHLLERNGYVLPVPSSIDCHNSDSLTSCVLVYYDYTKFVTVDMHSFEVIRERDFGFADLGDTPSKVAVIDHKHIAFSVKSSLLPRVFDDDFHELHFDGVNVSGEVLDFFVLPSFSKSPGNYGFQASLYLKTIDSDYVLSLSVYNSYDPSMPPIVNANAVAVVLETNEGLFAESSVGFPNGSILTLDDSSYSWNYILSQNQLVMDYNISSMVAHVSTVLGGVSLFNLDDCRYVGVLVGTDYDFSVFKLPTTSCATKNDLFGTLHGFAVRVDDDLHHFNVKPKLFPWISPESEFTARSSDGTLVDIRTTSEKCAKQGACYAPGTTVNAPFDTSENSYVCPPGMHMSLLTGQLFTECVACPVGFYCVNGVVKPCFYEDGCQMPGSVNPYASCAAGYEFEYYTKECHPMCDATHYWMDSECFPCGERFKCEMKDGINVPVPNCWPWYAKTDSGECIDVFQDPVHLGAYTKVFPRFAEASSIVGIIDKKLVFGGLEVELDSGDYECGLGSLDGKASILASSFSAIITCVRFDAEIHFKRIFVSEHSHAIRSTTLPWPHPAPTEVRMTNDGTTTGTVITEGGVALIDWPFEKDSVPTVNFAYGIDNCYPVPSRSFACVREGGIEYASGPNNTYDPMPLINSSTSSRPTPVYAGKPLLASDGFHMLAVAYNNTHRVPWMVDASHRLIEVPERSALWVLDTEEPDYVILDYSYRPIGGDRSLLRTVFSNGTASVFVNFDTQMRPRTATVTQIRLSGYSAVVHEDGITILNESGAYYVKIADTTFVDFKNTCKEGYTCPIDYTANGVFGGYCGTFGRAPTDLNFIETSVAQFTCPLDRLCNGMMEFKSHPGSFALSTGVSECYPGTFSSDFGASGCTACPPGSMTPFMGSVACELCEPGFFSNVTGSTTCSICYPGTASEIYGAFECQLCPAGTFSNVTECASCPAGTYQPSTGMSSCESCDGPNQFTNVFATDCIECPDGRIASADHMSCSYCPPNTYEDDMFSGICETVPAGYYLLDIATRAAIAGCPVGHFCAGGDAMPVPCPPGEYQDITGQTSCKPCPTGFTCVGGDAQPVLVCPPNSSPIDNVCRCDGGYYATNTSTSLECLQCPAHATCSGRDVYCEAGYEFTGGKCVACAFGTYNPIEGGICQACKPPMYTPSTTQCEACEDSIHYIGVDDCIACPEYKVVHAGSCTYCERGHYFVDGVCEYCPAGSFIPDLNLRSACVSCPNDHECDGGDTRPRIVCNPGYFRIENRCEKCPAGWFCPADGIKYKCPAGTFSALPGSSNCKTCPVNQYQENEGRASCRTCPINLIPNADHTDCVPCASGAFALLGNCVDCPSHVLCDSAVDPICADKSTQLSIDTGDLLHLFSCRACPAGRSCDGSIKSMPCDAGFYAPRGAGVCSMCAGNEISPAGAASCTACVNGEADPTHTFCTHCQTNQYFDGSSCHACPEHSHLISETQCGANDGYEGVGTAPADFIECRPGHYCLADSDPVPCPPNTFATGGAAECTACDASQFMYQPSVGSSACLVCSKRGYIFEDFECIECPPGSTSVDNKCLTCDLNCEDDSCIAAVCNDNHDTCQSPSLSHRLSHVPTALFTSSLENIQFLFDIEGVQSSANACEPNYPGFASVSVKITSDFDDILEYNVQSVTKCSSSNARALDLAPTRRTLVASTEEELEGRISETSDYSVDVEVSTFILSSDPLLTYLVDGVSESGRFGEVVSLPIGNGVVGVVGTPGVDGETTLIRVGFDPAQCDSVVINFDDAPIAFAPAGSDVFDSKIEQSAAVASYVVKLTDPNYSSPVAPLTLTCGTSTITYDFIVDPAPALRATASSDLDAELSLTTEVFADARGPSTIFLATSTDVGGVPASLELDCANVELSDSVVQIGGPLKPTAVLLSTSRAAVDEDFECQLAVKTGRTAPSPYESLEMTYRLAVIRPKLLEFDIPSPQINFGSLDVIVPTASYTQKSYVTAPFTITRSAVLAEETELLLSLSGDTDGFYFVFDDNTNAKIVPPDPTHSEKLALELRFDGDLSTLASANLVLSISGAGETVSFEVEAVGPFKPMNVQLLVGGGLTFLVVGTIAFIIVMRIVLRRLEHKRKIEAVGMFMDFGFDLSASSLEDISRLVITASSIEFTGEDLGRGGCGMVRKARYHGAEVAVKTLNPEYMPSNVSEENRDEAGRVATDLCRESHIQAELRHPNIVQLLGVAIDSETLGAVIELCNGGSLKQRTYNLNFNECTLEERLKWLHQAATGLAFLHRRDIVHRDIKAANVLIGNGEVAKLADLGLARDLNDGGVADEEAGQGTPSWLAPELLMITGEEIDFKASDVYAFGIMIWETIFGTQPYCEYENDGAVGVAIINGERPWLPENTGLDPRIIDLITRCWDQNPMERPGSDLVENILADIAGVEDIVIET